MNILGIERLVYGVQDLEASVRFHQDLGMELVESSQSGADFRMRNDTRVQLRRADDASLPPARIQWLPHLNGSTVREVVWGADSAQTLQEIATELTRDRNVTEDNTGTLHTIDDCGFHVGFAVTRRSGASLEPAPVNTVGTYGRLNRQAEAARKKPVGPHRAGHVVYWVRGDIPKQSEFYIDRLGFRLTDDGPSMRFMRCKGASDHHSLLFQREGDYYGFQHVAYEYKDHDEVMTVGSRLEGNGWKTNTGPLRHNISSSFSWYVWNPAGGAAEAYSDMDCVTDDWKPTYYDPKDPGFYGVSWVMARPGKKRARPGEWIDD
jgi:catechol 2,3-dioxygenase-like lactoylglutathione lyase family enzyme